MCRLSMIVPPQTVCFTWLYISTIHGNSQFSASVPPTIRNPLSPPACPQMAEFAAAAEVLLEEVARVFDAVVLVVETVVPVVRSGVVDVVVVVVDVVVGVVDAVVVCVEETKDEIENSASQPLEVHKCKLSVATP